MSLCDNAENVFKPGNGRQGGCVRFWGGEVSAKKMFGDYGLFCDGKMVGIIGDDQLFIKVTAVGEELFPDAVLTSPYPGAKPCLVIPPERWGDEEWLAELITETTKLLPAPKPKNKK